VAERIFKRKLYEQMLQWKKDMDGRTALLIKGARRVGKSTIVEQFAQNEYESHVIIDFANVTQEMNELFDNVADLNFFFLKLQALTRVDLIEGNSVIVFDEVQLQPKARQAIKYLVKDGRYDYIETGSLLSIKKNIKGILIPSEETRITMYPMDYEEFLWAQDDYVTAKIIRESLLKRIPLGDAVNRKLMRDFRLYMLVGGMPQAINAYLNNSNFRKIDEIKRNIIELYEDDFRKIDSSGKASLFFKNIPSELSRGAVRFMPSKVNKNMNGERVGEVIADILDSMTVNAAYHTDDPSVGFALTKNSSVYKLYLADTGLFVTLAFMDKDYTENNIYEKLLSDKLSANLGYIYENVIAQMLRASGNQLYYYTFPSDKSNRNYEIDFLLSKKNKICPIEVKSSGYKTHKSLDAFSKKYSNRILNKYLVYTKDLKVEQDIIMLPMYMIPFLQYDDTNNY
jgi:predicted AAA+ superfamily ATPase